MKRLVLFLGTPANAFAEWLMYELLRTPYRPPHDMLTFLGTEKFPLAAFMIGLGVVWSGVVAITFATKTLNLRDHFVFVAILAVILAFVQYIVRNPGRSVTPWELLWS